eukprot:345485-Chlamydomonas_euryale.AAC.1
MHVQALAAINAQNGVDLGGRRMLVREDREDRDVKAATGEEGAAPPPPPAAAPRRVRRERGPPVDRSGESSGLQVWRRSSVNTACERSLNFQKGVGRRSMLWADRHIASSRHSWGLFVRSIGGIGHSCPDSDLTYPDSDLP